MLTVLMIVLIHFCVVAINITVSSWVVLSDDNITELHFKRNASAFFIIFCPITNIFGMMILVVAVSAIWLLKCSNWLNK